MLLVYVLYRTLDRHSALPQLLSLLSFSPRATIGAKSHIRGKCVARPTSQPGQNTSLLVWVVQILSLAYVLAFMLSALLNSIVFYVWGADFLAIASFSDVAMSGMKLLLIFSVLLAAACPPFYAIAYLGGRKIRLDVAVLSEISLRVVAPLALSVPIILSAYDYFRFSRNVLIAGLSFLIYILVFAGLVALAQVAFRAIHRSRRRSVAGYAMFGVTLTAFSLAVLLCVARWGYDFHPLYFRPLPEDADCPATSARVPAPSRICSVARILWIGESSLLARCDATDKVIVLKGAENVQLLDHR